MFILVCYPYWKKKHFLYKCQLHNFTVSSIKIYPGDMKTIFNDEERVFGEEKNRLLGCICPKDFI